MSEASPTKVYDIYAPILNYKLEITAAKNPLVSLAWIPDDHLRRIQAYEILSAFYFNFSRDYRFSPESGDSSQNDSIFEDGTPAWLCNRIKAKLFGESYGISIKQPRQVKNIKKLQSQLATSEEQGERSKLEREIASRIEVRDRISEREEYLQDWWDENDIMLVIDENESKASYLGDMAYFVEWLEGEQRPNILTYDPGFVFPMGKGIESLDDGKGLCERTIICWQEEVGDASYEVTWDCFELRGAQCWRRRAIYEYDGSAEMDIEAMPERSLIEGTDTGWQSIGIDFMPVLMVPNIAVQNEDYGLSNLHFMIGNFDALMNLCTDLRNNGEKLGGAIVFASGKSIRFKKDTSTGEPSSIELQAGTMYAIGEDGNVTILDTSKMQEALLATIKQVERTIIRNSEITEVGAGLVDSQEISGIALKVLSQPLVEKIGSMRANRRKEYAMLFWMVERLWQIFGTPEEKALFADPLYDVQINFGAILPVDKKSQYEEWNLLKALVGEETALELAQSEGLDIDVESVLAKKRQEAQERMQSEMDLFAVRRETGEE